MRGHPRRRGPIARSCRAPLLRPPRLHPFARPPPLRARRPRRACAPSAQAAASSSPPAARAGR
eukprot:2808496-Prymnesium_polylepis.1